MAFSMPWAPAHEWVNVSSGTDCYCKIWWDLCYCFGEWKRCSELC